MKKFFTVLISIILVVNTLYFVKSTVYAEDYNAKYNITFKGDYNVNYLSLIQTNDGYIGVGSYSKYNEGGLKDLNHGDEDALIIKYDKDGNVVWQKNFGGSKYDDFTDIVQTNDNNYIVVGYSNSNDYDLQDLNKGEDDAIIVKYDNNGNILWKKDFGGSQYELFYTLTSLQDGGIITVGSTTSNDGDVQNLNKGIRDGLIVRYDSSGNIVWKKTFGGSDSDSFYFITKASEDIFDIIGSFSSQDGDLYGLNDDYSFYSLKYNINGEIVKDPITKEGDLTLITTVEPTITLSTSTNSIDFGNISPLQDSYTQNMTVTVQSNNTYSLSLVASDDFKTADATPSVMGIDHLKVITNGDIEQTMSKSIPVVLANNQPNTNSTIYNIGLKLDTDWNVNAGGYSTNLLFKVQQ